MRYLVGASQVPLRLLVKDATGAAVTPATATVSIVQPDGSPASLTLAGGGLVAQAVGDLIGYFTPTLPGRHTWSGATTSPGTGYGPDTFDATSASDAPIASLAEARAYLNMGSTVNDGQLLDMLAGCSDLCEQKTRRIWRRTTVTGEQHDGGGCELPLRKTPVASVTSVVESGSTLTFGTDCFVAADGWLLVRGTTLAPLSWIPGRANIVVTYVAGPPDGVIPDPIIRGTLELVRHQAETMRGGGNRPRQAGADTEWDPRLGYAFPRRVLQMWEPFMGPAGF